MTNAGAFGGSGAALTRSMTEDSLARGRATTSANLRDQAFNVGAGLSGQDADRRQAASIASAQLGEQALSRQLAAAGQLAGLAGAYDENQRGNIGVQGSLGSTLRDIEQQRLQAPISLLGAQGGLTSQLPLQLFNGSKSVQKASDPIGQFASLAGGLGALGLAPFTGGASVAALGGVASGFGGANLAAALTPGVTAGLRSLYKY